MGMSVYVLVAALGARGFKVDFCATRKPKSKTEPAVVLITGDSDAINGLMAEMVSVCGIVPAVADASRPNETSRSTLATFRRAE